MRSAQDTERVSVPAGPRHGPCSRALLARLAGFSECDGRQGHKGNACLRCPAAHVAYLREVNECISYRCKQRAGRVSRGRLAGHRHQEAAWAVSSVGHRVCRCVSLYSQQRAQGLPAGQKPSPRRALDALGKPDLTREAVVTRSHLRPPTLSSAAATYSESNFNFN